MFAVTSLFRRKQLKGPCDDSWGMELYLFRLQFVSQKLLKSHIRTSFSNGPQLLLKHVAWERLRKQLWWPFSSKAVGLMTLLLMEKCCREAKDENEVQTASASLQPSVVFS